MATLNFSQAPREIKRELNDLSFNIVSEASVYDFEIEKNKDGLYALRGGSGMNKVYLIIPSNFKTATYINNQF